MTRQTCKTHSWREFGSPKLGIVYLLCVVCGAKK